MAKRLTKTCFWVVLYGASWFPSHAQGLLEKAILQANDSLIRNPNFSYRLLCKIRKEYPHKEYTLSLAMANYFFNISQPDSTLYYGQKALSLAPNKARNGSLLRMIGGSYLRIGKYDEALPWLLESAEIAQKEQNNKLAIYVKSELGWLYLRKKSYQKALGYLKKAAALAQKEIVSKKLLCSIGGVYHDMGNLAAAKSYYTQSIENLVVSEHPLFVATVLNNLGELYVAENSQDKAAATLDSAYALATKHNFRTLACSATISRASAAIKQKAYSQAISLLQQALTLALATSNLTHQAAIYQNMVEALKLQGDFKSAFHKQIEYYKVLDSIHQKRFDKVIKEMEVKYETIQKEKEIAILKALATSQKNKYQALALENSLKEERHKNEILQLANTAQKTRNKNILLQKAQAAKENEIKRQKLIKQGLLAGAIALIIPTMFFMVVYYQKHQKQKALNRYQREANTQRMAALVKDQEIALIKTAAASKKKEQERIARELHDHIGGNLAMFKLKLAYYNELEQKDVEALVVQVDETCQLVRDLSHDLTSDKMDGYAFVDKLRAYLQEVPKNMGIDVKLYVYPENAINEVNAKVCAELMKTIKELLNNTLKHANARHLCVSLNKRGPMINLIFEDDGVGFDPHKPTDGIGLKNIYTRIAALQGHMHLDTHPGRGTLVNIDVPVCSPKQVSVKQPQTAISPYTTDHSIQEPS